MAGHFPDVVLVTIQVVVTTRKSLVTYSTSTCCLGTWDML